MEVRANAKVNLCLDVLRRRKYGYHDLEMIMVPLQLHDLLQVELAKQDELHSDDKQMPLDERNTICRVISLMREMYQLKAHFYVSVRKHIPMEAGLAGGSADAAAMIHAIDILCGLHLSMEDKIRIGKQIGADVPFCLVNQPALVSGIGEKIEPFTFSCDFHMLLVKPSEGVSTKTAYQMLDLARCAHPDCEAVKAKLQEDDFAGLCQEIGNSLEESAFRLTSAVQKLKAELTAYGFAGVLMSGSGSCVFALTQDESLLKDAYQHFRQHYPFVEMTTVRK